MPSDGSLSRLSSIFVILLFCLVAGVVLNGLNLRKLSTDDGASTDLYNSVYAQMLLPLSDNNTALTPVANNRAISSNMESYQLNDRPIAVDHRSANDLDSVDVAVLGNRTTYNTTITATATDALASSKPIAVYIMLHGFQGRLGNYLMQYSAALGMARQIGAHAKLCLTSKTMKKRASVHQLFQGPFAAPCPNRNRGIGSVKDWTEPNATFEAGFVDEARNCSSTSCAFRMTGFWSSHRYFDGIRDELRSVWNLTEPHYSRAQDYLRMQRRQQQQINATNAATVLIGIHVRRGDMLAVKAYEIPDIEYYQRAMEYYRALYSTNHVRFLIASDDKNWCRSNFRSRNDTTTVVLPNGLSASMELHILAQCRHVITSVGTFGWWSAYLSQSDEAIYPTKAYGKDWWTAERLQSFLLTAWKGL